MDHIPIKPTNISIHLQSDLMGRRHYRNKHTGETKPLVPTLRQLVKNIVKSCPPREKEDEPSCLAYHLEIINGVKGLKGFEDAMIKIPFLQQLLIDKMKSGEMMWYLSHQGTQHGNFARVLKCLNKFLNGIHDTKLLQSGLWTSYCTISDEVDGDAEEPQQQRQEELLEEPQEEQQGGLFEEQEENVQESFNYINSSVGELELPDNQLEAPSDESNQFDLLIQQYKEDKLEELYPTGSSDRPGQQ